MPEMPNCDVDPILIPIYDYLVCSSRRNHPRVKYTICESTCKDFKKCPYYSKWYLFNFGIELELPKKKSIRITKKRSSKKRSKKKGG